MVSSKPYQYTKGWVEFYKLRFKVTPDTLIPRPETELLVDEVLQFISQPQSRNCNSSKKSNNKLSSNKQLSNNKVNNNKAKNLSPIIILDIGTGSGNIAISLAKNLSHPYDNRLDNELDIELDSEPNNQPNNKSEPKGSVSQNQRLPDVKIIASDISKKALKIAKQNAKLHKVEDKIEFVQSNLLSNLDLSDLNYTLIIVTNLPYIPTGRIPYLDPSVKDFEPHIALDGGKDGFDLYRKLFSQIKEKSWQTKLIIGEIDYTHGELAINESQNYFPDFQIETKNDLTHKQRILLIKRGL
ncbi:peptide chain release factor N(5)-glutamine methyltransferase [Patescibacteria group bacterium]|nr:peptide chain release factor N(5)-glutamine methyltransferase [Patescibacteria group bacterium]